jgi:hypothetical protein
MEDPSPLRETYVGGGLEDGCGWDAPSRRAGGSGGAPRLKRSALVSRRAADARGRTEVKSTKMVRATAASLCMAAKSRKHKRGIVLGAQTELKELVPCS